MRDFRHALRGLAHDPLFAVVTVTTLAVGIGTCTAIFSLVYQILLRPLPFADPERLVFIWNSYPGNGLPKASVSIPDYLDRRTQAPALEDATLFTVTPATLADGGEPELVRALAVTPSFFSTLGRSPVLGRGFTDTEGVSGGPKVAVLTHGLWTSRFGADRAIVGRDIRLNGEPHLVVGVLGADFDLPSRGAHVLTPFAFTPTQMSDAGRGNEFSSMIARLRPGATIAELEDQMADIVRRNLERLPERRAFTEASGFRGQVVPIRTELVGDARAALYVLQAAVVALLLIACVNVANLMLMRAVGRGREMAIRKALGAGRWRLVRQTLSESLVIAVLGGGAGLALGLAGVRILVGAEVSQIPEHVTASLYAPVVVFAVLLTLGTALVFGMAPALAGLSEDSQTALKDDAARGSSGRAAGRARASLVVTEIAVALVLLVGAGLLLRSLMQLQTVNPGFTANGVLTAQIALPATRYEDPPAQRQFWTRLLEQSRGLPGVQAVGVTSNVPFNGMVSSGSYTIVGRTLSPGEAVPHGRQEIVGGEYFRAMGIPLLSGRLFTDADTPDAAPVVIVDQHLVDRYFQGMSPLGHQIRRGANTPPFTIVGVVGTINSIDLGQPATKERLYYPMLQQSNRSMGIVVRTGRDTRSIVQDLRRAVQSIDPLQPIADVRTMSQWIDLSMAGRRTPAMLLGVFAAVAVLLSGVGIYGVLAFGVAERQRELGIRQALGADSRAILSLVLNQGARTTGLGVGVGLVAAFGLTRHLNSLLFGVGSLDPGVFGAVTFVLLIVATAACYIPARRATRVDPASALRQS
jgi:predicted permease